MKKRIEGIVPPVITPLDKNGNLDDAALVKHHEYLIRNGVAALFVLGTTGEGPALSQRLKEKMIVRTVENTAKRLPVLVGISADDLDDYLNLASFAARSGADGVVAAPPCYLPLEESELLDFYRILTLEQPLPVYIYNMPAMTKIEMSPDLILQIAELPGIAGYKDSTGNFANFEKAAAVLKKRPDFSLFMGPDALLGKALDAGACGGVNSGANLAPQLFVGMYQSQKKQDRAMMEMYQKGIDALQKIYQFRENICCGAAAGLKYGLNKLGITEKYLIRPARPMEQQDVIDHFVEELKTNFPLR